MGDQTQELKLGGDIKMRFESNLRSMRYVFANGDVAHFVQGEYFTNKENEIEELGAEVDAGHPHISIDKAKLLVDTKFRTPEEKIREQIIAELQAQGRLIAEGTSDFGTSDQQLKLQVGNTRDVASAMSGSSSGDAPATGTASVATGIKIGPRA